MGNPRAGRFKPGTKDPETADRWRKALELRRAGASYDAIALQLGFADASGAYRAVVAALKATVAEPADDVRRLELERLDRLMLGVWQAATSHEDPEVRLKAIERVLAVMRRRAELLGLDAPKKTDVTSKGEGVGVGAVVMIPDNGRDGYRTEPDPPPEDGDPAP